MKSFRNHMFPEKSPGASSEDAVRPSSPDIYCPSSEKDRPPSYHEYNLAQPASSSTPSSASFAWVDLSLTDRLRFLNVPSSDVDHAEHAVRYAWYKGIQSAGPYGPACGNRGGCSKRLWM